MIHVRIRPSAEADMPAVTAMYAHFVVHASGTFEETPPSLEEMTRAGELTSVGFKFGRWIETVRMQRACGGRLD